MEGDAMATYAKPRESLEERVRRLESPTAYQSVERLTRRYAKIRATADEVREELDRVMGDRTLTEELYRMRGKKW
jgi:hypothetical protein